MNLQTNWKNYFEKLDTNEVSNSNLHVFAKATAVHEDFQPSDSIKSLTEDEDIIIMTIAPVTKNVKFLHSPTNLGGTRIRPTNKLVALDGFGINATSVLIDETCATNTVDLRTPSGTNLKNMRATQDITNSVGPTGGNKNFQHLSYLILPPFIAHNLVDQESRDPVNIFIKCNHLIETYDRTNENVSGFKKAADECKNILPFLWSASKGLIPPTIFVTGSDDGEVEKWKSQRHNNCISHNSPSTNQTNNNGVNDAIIQSLTYSIDNQTTLFENLRQEKQDEKEEKLNKYGDLHDSTKLLILNASSPDGEITPIEPVLNCKEFFNKKNVTKALDYLESTLTQDLGCCVSIETGLVTALYSGHFLRDREDSPSNFSFFMTPKKMPLSANKLKPTMILQLKASQGKGWSETDLKEALKQGIVTPHDIHTLAHQLKNFWGLSAFFFGKDSILAKAIEPMLQQLSLHTLTFEASQLRDKMFATKLGYAIDTRVFRWLQLCQNNKDRNLVNDSLLNFRSYLRSNPHRLVHPNSTHNLQKVFISR